MIGPDGNECLGPDDETLNTCPNCSGHGAQTIGTYDIDGRAHPISAQCYLCNGRGAITYALVVMWQDAGRPQVRCFEGD